MLRSLTGYLSIKFPSRLDSVVGACTSTRVMTVRIRLPAPLGRRQVMINSDTTAVFAPGYGALLGRCGEFGCGPFALPRDAPCDPDLVATRWFFRAGAHGWVTITTAPPGGCMQVHKAEPQFPARLCAGLSAP